PHGLFLATYFDVSLSDATGRRCEGRGAMPEMKLKDWIERALAVGATEPGVVRPIATIHWSRGRRLELAWARLPGGKERLRLRCDVYSEHDTAGERIRIAPGAVN